MDNVTPCPLGKAGARRPAVVLRQLHVAQRAAHGVDRVDQVVLLEVRVVRVERADDVRMPDRTHQRSAGRSGVQEVALEPVQRFDGEPHAERLAAFASGAQHLGAAMELVGARRLLGEPAVGGVDRPREHLATE